MEDEKFQGWSNHATWNVALWLDNDYPLYVFAQGLFKRLVTSGDGTALNLAHILRTWVTTTPEVYSKFDIKRIELEQVNWQEIAEHYFSEAALEQGKE